MECLWKEEGVEDQATDQCQHQDHLLKFLKQPTSLNSSHGSHTVRTGPTSVGGGRPGPPCLPRRSQGLELSWARVGPGLSIPEAPQGPPTCREWRTTGAVRFPASGPNPATRQNPRGPLGLHMVPGDRGAGKGARRALEWQVTARRPPGGARFPASLRRHTTPSLQAPKPSPPEPGCRKDPLSSPVAPDLWLQCRVMRLGASSNAYSLAPKSG